MALSKKVDGVLEQWPKDNIPRMRAQHGPKWFKFHTDNGKFNSKAYKDQVASSGGILITNYPYSPETMSILERFWRIIVEVAAMMLIHCGFAENFWEEVTLYAVDIYNRVPPAYANRAGLRQSPFKNCMKSFHL